MIKNVILDFGHGGVDHEGNYTTSPNKMYKFENGEIAYEGVLNRELGEKLSNYLYDDGFINVVHTVHWSDSYDLPLSNRVDVADGFNPNETIFISLHCNASRQHNASGFEVITSKGSTDSDVLASYIVDNVKDFLIKNDIKLRSDYSDGDVDKEASLYLLRKTKCPAVLIEFGFFDFYEEFKKLSDPKIQDLYSFHVYKAIKSYICSFVK